MIGIIYKYTSPSGKCYIGQTIHEELRKAQHKSAAKDESLKWPFYKAIRKYGWDNMSYEVLVKFECDNRQLLFKILDHFEIFISLSIIATNVDIIKQKVDIQFLRNGELKMKVMDLL